MPETELTSDPGDKDYSEINPETGMQRAYVVLTAEERAKGFIEPIRRSYVHVGCKLPSNLRDLTEDEIKKHQRDNYVGFEQYEIDRLPVLGKFWTQAMLDRVNAGCGTVTTMALAIAETYSRNPEFYSGTFCAHCKRHFPIGEDGEFVWEGTDQRVGTRSNTEPK